MILAENNKYKSSKKLKILNFYSDGCPPCHAFMPNFIAAEKTFGGDFDFININSGKNIELSTRFKVRGTPTIIIMNNKEIVYNKAGIPNGQELKDLMIKLIGEQAQKIRRNFFEYFNKK